MKTWFWRHELEWVLERDIKDFLSFQKKPISVDKIEEKYIRYSEICNKYWLSNFHKEKYRKFLSKEHAYGVALEICELLNLKDTSSFSKDMINQDLINKLIDYRVQKENKYNEEVEKKGTGTKRHLYQYLDGLNKDNETSLEM